MPSPLAAIDHDPFPFDRLPTMKPRNPIKRAFVLMPFRDELEELYEQVFKIALGELGYEVKRADDLFVPRTIIADVQQAIIDADLLICEMSGRNPNVFYELGLGHAVGRPAILVTQNIDDVPFDVKAIRIIEYKRDQNGWQDELRERIKKATIAVEESEEPWPSLLKPASNRELKNRLEITSPRNGDVRTGVFSVEGTYEMEPIAGSVYLFLTALDNHEYWPQEAVEINAENGTWSGAVQMYEKPPREAHVVVAGIGDAARILITHYLRVGQEKGIWYPLQDLSSLVVEYDRVWIRNKEF